MSMRTEKKNKFDKLRVINNLKIKTNPLNIF